MPTVDTMGLLFDCNRLVTGANPASGIGGRFVPRFPLTSECKADKQTRVVVMVVPAGLRKHALNRPLLK